MIRTETCQAWDIRRLKNNYFAQHCISVMWAKRLKFDFLAPKRLFGRRTVNRSETRTTLILDRWA